MSDKNLKKFKRPQKKKIKADPASYNVHKQQDWQTGRPRDWGQGRVQGHGTNSGLGCRWQSSSTTSWLSDLRQALLSISLSCVCFLSNKTGGNTGIHISGFKQPQTKTISEKKISASSKMQNLNLLHAGN